MTLSEFLRILVFSYLGYYIWVCLEQLFWAYKMKRLEREYGRRFRAFVQRFPEAGKEVARLKALRMIEEALKTKKGLS